MSETDEKLTAAYDLAEQLEAILDDVWMSGLARKVMEVKIDILDAIHADPDPNEGEILHEL